MASQDSNAHKQKFLSQCVEWVQTTVRFVKTGHEGSKLQREKLLEYEWRSITVSPVPWHLKVTAFNRLKDRISCRDVQKAGFNPCNSTDTGESLNILTTHGWDSTAVSFSCVSVCLCVKDKFPSLINFILHACICIVTHRPHWCASLYRLHCLPRPRLHAHCKGSHCGHNMQTIRITATTGLKGEVSKDSFKTGKSTGFLQISSFTFFFPDHE